MVVQDEEESENIYNNNQHENSSLERTESIIDGNVSCVNGLKINKDENMSSKSVMDSKLQDVLKKKKVTSSFVRCILLPFIECLG